MYQGGMVAKQEAEKRADAQLLGEKEVELQAEEEPSKVSPLKCLCNCLVLLPQAPEDDSFIYPSLLAG